MNKPTLIEKPSVTLYSEATRRVAESHNLHFITDVAFKLDKAGFLRRSSIVLDMASSHIYLSDRNSPSYISSQRRLSRGEATSDMIFQDIAESASELDGEIQEEFRWVFQGFQGEDEIEEDSIPEILSRTELIQGISFQDIMEGDTPAFSEDVQEKFRWIFQSFQDKMKTGSIQSDYRYMRKEMKREVRWQRISRTSWGLGISGTALFASYLLLPEVGRDIAAQFFVSFSAPIIQIIRDSIEWYAGYLKQVNINIGCVKSLI